MLGNAFYQKSLAIVLGLSLVAASHTAFAGDQRTRIECKEKSATEDASMDARFESKGSRDKFSASFETAPGGSFMAGDMLQVKVDGETVGNITLAVEPNDDLGGDLNFDTTAGPADDDAPFPANWPGADAGTVVMVGTLGCSLQER